MFENEAFEQQKISVETEIKEDAHEWGEWTVRIPATCEHAGEETSLCKYNEDHIQARMIDQLEHVYNTTYEWSEDLSSVTAEKACKYGKNQQLSL